VTKKLAPKLCQMARNPCRMPSNIHNATDCQSPREGRMKVFTVSAVALSVLGFATAANAQQQGARVFFECDVIRGAQQGAPVRFCVLNNQFKRLEKVVFRFRIVDGDGKALDDKGIKSLFVELPGGQKLQAGYGQHPPRGEAADYFWTAAWIIPTEQPTGTF